MTNNKGHRTNSKEPGTRLPCRFPALALMLSGWLFLLPAGLSADLSWTAGEGWFLRGGTNGELHRPPPREALARMNEARQAQAENRHGTALRRYRQVYRRYPDSLYAPEAYYQSGIIRIERNQWSRAFEAFNELTQHYPEFPRFDRVIGHQFDIAVRLAEGERLRLFWIVPGFRSMERAVEMFESVVSNAPFSEYAPVSLAYIAHIDKNRGQPEGAIDAYERLITDYPDHLLTPDAYIGLARAYGEMVTGPQYDQGSTRQAIAYFEDFMILYPNSPYIETAESDLEEMRDVLARSKLIIGDFYNKRRTHYTAARVFYNEAITVAPTSPAADEARERLDEIEGLEDRPMRRFFFF